MSWQQTMDSMFGYHYGNNSPHPHTPHGTHERVQRLKRPPSLPRIQLHDDIGIVPDHEKKAKKNNSYAQTPNPTSSARKRMKRSKSSKRIETNPKILELEAKIGSLTRDNRVLQRKLEKVESSTGKKQKKMDNEREMRLAAHKERYSLQQKLEKLQKAISVRLKLLGVDFSKIDDITTALDTCFSVIRKLAKELQDKEEELQATKDKLTQATSDLTAANKFKKQINVLTEMNKSCMDNQASLYHEIDEYKTNLQRLKEEKVVLQSDLDAKIVEVERLNHENTDLNTQKEELMRSRNDFEGQLKESMQKVEALENELENMKTGHEEMKADLMKENDTKWKNKCNEYDVLNEKYKTLKTQRKSDGEKLRLEHSEYEKKIKSLTNKLNAMQSVKKDEKEKEVTWKQTITALHEEIAERDKMVKSQKKK
eukprot:780149_1